MEGKKGRQVDTTNLDKGAKKTQDDLSVTFLHFIFWCSQPRGQFDEGQKITLLRKAYQRAIELPIHNLEAIWKDYDSWENELNPTLVRKTKKKKRRRRRRLILTLLHSLTLSYTHRLNLFFKNVLDVI
jgi:hypothetical protein